MTDHHTDQSFVPKCEDCGEPVDISFEESRCNRCMAMLCGLCKAKYHGLCRACYLDDGQAKGLETPVRIPPAKDG